MKTSLPTNARTSINRCNLPVEVFGDVSFQTHPKKVYIDGVAEMHKRLFQELDNEPDCERRFQWFDKHMHAHFLLDALDDAGYESTAAVDRSRANYLRILRGWFFDSDSLEGAVIKSWVESRFGLIPRYHKGSIRSFNDKNYAQYISLASRGLYNTNALEAQLDLLFSYCQYELQRRFPEKKSLLLYRGLNHMQFLERIEPTNNSTDNHGKFPMQVLLNNINSFSMDPTRASEFGDIVISAEVPFSKLLFFSGLMPGIMTSEKEYAVIGGVYEVDQVTDINGQTSK